MEFTKKELAVLNQMVSIALLSGQVEFNEMTKSVYNKIAKEIEETHTNAEKLSEGLADSRKNADVLEQRLAAWKHTAEVYENRCENLMRYCAFSLVASILTLLTVLTTVVITPAK